MHLECLGYAGVWATELAPWKEFATAVLGLQTQETATGLALRMDERVHRILIHPHATNGVAYLGWDVGDAGRLAAAESELTFRGLSVRRATPSELGPKAPSSN